MCHYIMHVRIIHQDPSSKTYMTLDIALKRFTRCEDYKTSQRSLKMALCAGYSQTNKI